MKSETHLDSKFISQGKNKTIKGTILVPEAGNLRLVLVPCSMSGKPDGDLYSVLEKKWKNAKAEYKGWFSNHFDFKMGALKSTAVQSDTWLMHCLFLNKEGKVEEKALTDCIKKLSDMAKFEKASVHVSSLTVSQYPGIKDLLQKSMIEKGVSVYYYEEPGFDIPEEPVFIKAQEAIVQEELKPEETKKARISFSRRKK